MARGSVRIPLIVDPSGVKRGTAEAQSSLAGFQAKAETSLGKITTAASSLGLAFGGTIGLAYGIKQATEAWEANEKVTARQIATMKNLGINTAGARAEIDKTIKSQAKLGAFDTQDLVSSYTQFLQVTRSTTESTKLNALAMDLARGKGISLQSAQLALLKAYNGNYTALNRMGVAIQKGSSAQSAFALVQQRFAGQAKQYGESSAGAVDKANVAWTNFVRTLGGDVAPAAVVAAQGLTGLTNVTGGLVDKIGGLGPLVAGAAGFGAFKLAQGPLAEFGSKVTTVGSIIGSSSEGLGAKLAFIGSESGLMVSPMTAAAGAAALMAGGIYELYANSESASQAASTLSSDISGLNSAMGEHQTAHENLALARVSSQQAGQAVAQQQSSNRSLHSQVIADDNSEAAAKKNAANALQLYGKNSKQYIQAYHDAAAAVTKAAGTNKAYNEGLQTEGQLAALASVANQRLKAAHQDLKISAGGVSDALDKVAKKSQDVVNQAIAATTQIHVAARAGESWTTTLNGSAGAADKFASLMLSARDATAKSDVMTRQADTNLAHFARSIGDVPSNKEIRLIVKYTSEGLSLDQIRTKLNALQNKTIKVTTETFNKNFRVPSNTNPLTGKPTAATSSTGSWIGGSWTGMDSVPVTVAPGEVILNPGQQSMVDGGMTVDQALAATGAPVIGPGTSHSGGGTPVKTQLSQSGLPTPGHYVAPKKGKSSRSGSGRHAKAVAPADPRVAKWLTDFAAWVKPITHGVIGRESIDFAEALERAITRDDAQIGYFHPKNPTQRTALTDARHHLSILDSDAKHRVSEILRAGVPGEDAFGQRILKLRDNLTTDTKKKKPETTLHKDHAALRSAYNTRVQTLKRMKARTKNVQLRQMIQAKIDEYTRDAAGQVDYTLDPDPYGIAGIQAQLAADDQAIAASSAVIDPTTGGPIGTGTTAEYSTAETDARTEISKIQSDIASGRYNPVQVAELNQDLTDAYGTLSGYESAAAPSASSTTDPDLQAQLTQSQQVAQITARQYNLSETALRALTGTGSDIGTGQFGNVEGAGAGIVIQTMHPADPQTLALIAASTTRALGTQSFVQTNRAFIGPS